MESINNTRLLHQDYSTFLLTVAQTTDHTLNYNHMLRTAIKAQPFYNLCLMVITEDDVSLYFSNPRIYLMAEKKHVIFWQQSYMFPITPNKRGYVTVRMLKIYWLLFKCIVFFFFLILITHSIQFYFKTVPLTFGRMFKCYEISNIGKTVIFLRPRHYYFLFFLLILGQHVMEKKKCNNLQHFHKNI